MLVLEKSMSGEAVSGREVKDVLVEKLGCSESSVQKSLSDLRENNVVRFEKRSLERGFDWIYWV